MNNLRDIIRTDAAFEILDGSNCAGSDWGAGGCAILAHALNKLEGYPMYVIYNEDFKGAEHFGVKTPKGTFIDHDGEHDSKEEWIKFFKENEHPRSGSLVVIPFSSSVGMEGIKFDDAASDKLAKLIQNHKMIRETIRDVIKESNNDKVWYHGTPDVRELEKEGGFTQRYINVEYVEDLEAWDKIQDEIRDARESGNDEEYFNALDKVKGLRKSAKIRKPIFLTDVYSIARTYADPQRAFDYQNSVEKVLKVNVKNGKGVTINAFGDRFRFISVNKVIRGFVNAGIDEQEIKDVIAKLNFAVGVEKGIKTDNVAAIGDWLGFDYIDVTGVLDSYNGGSTKSTVRMVFDPSDITMSVNEGNSYLNELEQYLNEAFGSINESDEPSPTFEWDIAKEKIDKSKRGINTAEKAYEYLNWFLDKVKALPKSVKLKLTKYVIMSLMVFLGASTINSIVSDKAPEISQSIAIAINVPEESPVEEVVVETPTSVSDSLVEFLKHEEGSIKHKGEPVLSAYDIGDGMITIGWGHAEKIDDSNFRKGDNITYEKAEELLEQDIESAKAGLDRLLGRWDEAGVEYQIDQGMYDGMVSMIFNMGIGNFLKSDFIQLVKFGDYDEAAEEILTTNVSYPGHVPRREKEKEMFTSGNSTQAQQMAMNEARKIVKSVLKENLQLADKFYFTPGKLSPEVRRIMVSEKMTGGDVWTKLVTDIYMAYLEQSDRQSEMIGNHILSKDEKPEPYVRETDVLQVKEWREIKELYGHLKTYNKNVFPIAGFNINGVEDIWSLIRGLKQRATIIEELKKLPSVAIRNMKEDIRTPRSGNSMNSYRDQLETFLAYYSQLGNRKPELQSVIHRKMFKKGVDLDDLMDFVEEKENLLGGAAFDKNMVNNIIEESDELEKIYEQGSIVVVKVDGPYGIKEIGCNSLWCFTYGQGYDANWSNYSYNDVVYVIIDFSEEPDSHEFMYVLIKPVDWDTEDEDANEDVIFDMKNDGYYDARNLLDSVFSREKAKELFTFDIEPEEEEEDEEEDYEKEYVDPNQLSLFEVRKIVNQVLRESVINEVIEGEFVAYHGSPNEIKRFTDDFVGGKDANDAQGAGIYFATNPEDAAHYGEHIHKVIIKGNFLDRNAPIENVDINELVSLIKMKDEWEMDAQDYSEDPDDGAYEAASMAIQYNGDEAEAFQQIEADFYRYESVNYVRNMTKLGYDGIIVDAPSDFVGDKHIIVFNPSVITFIDKVG